MPRRATVAARTRRRSAQARANNITGSGGTAVGSNAAALTTHNNSARGFKANASGATTGGATAIGASANATGNGALGVGSGASATGHNSVAVGVGTVANLQAATAVGSGARVQTGTNNGAFGTGALVCEEAFRRAPETIASVLLFNTQGLKLVPHFLELTGALDLFRAGKLFSEGRLPIAEVLHRHIDAVVVHQWENDLNYLYWDVLWSGHPLIHNSPAIEGVGYAYADFDPADGGRVLVDAVARHRARAGGARDDAMDFLRRFSIDAPAVRARHEQLLNEVLQ